MTAPAGHAKPAGPPFLVRVLLVPRRQRLAGGANCWAPGLLRLIYARYGIREDDGPASVAPLPARQAARA